jgi:nucleoside-diphosphate-sugar epimerase
MGMRLYRISLLIRYYEEEKSGTCGNTYFSLQHPDNYSRTKAIAETIILQANGSPVEGGGDGDVLRTCALRLAGVYGPGEHRHLPRIVVSVSSISSAVISHYPSFEV